jgi:hypothetical protein
MRRLSYLLLLVTTLFIQQVSEMVPRIARRSSRFFMTNLDTSDPNDPEVIIKIDRSNVFNTTCRALTLDVLSGRASRDYACCLKHGKAIPTCENLSNLFGYFKAMRSCHAKLRYFDWDGQFHLVKDKTGGQQGDPLEILVFNLTTLHLWGRVLAKEARAAACG